jgi:hypothetical protein
MDTLLDSQDTDRQKSSVVDSTNTSPTITASVVEVDPAMSASPTVAYQRPESLHGLQDQSVRLPFHRLLLIYFGIGTALFVSFLDQTSVSTAAPVIGADIGGSER